MNRESENSYQFLKIELLQDDGTDLEDVINTAECALVPVNTSIKLFCKEGHRFLQVINFQFLVVQFFLRIQNKTSWKEDADNHVELLCPDSGEFPSNPLPPCVRSVTCGPPPNRFRDKMELSSSGSDQVTQSQAMRSSYSEIWNLMTTHHLWFLDF